MPRAPMQGGLQTDVQTAVELMGPKASGTAGAEPLGAARDAVPPFMLLEPRVFGSVGVFDEFPPSAGGLVGLAGAWDRPWDGPVTGVQSARRAFPDAFQEMRPRRRQ